MLGSLNALIRIKMEKPAALKHRNYDSFNRPRSPIEPYLSTGKQVARITKKSRPQKSDFDLTYL